MNDLKKMAASLWCGGVWMVESGGDLSWIYGACEKIAEKEVAQIKTNLRAGPAKRPVPQS